jgi:hypothetical protein
MLLLYALRYIQPVSDIGICLVVNKLILVEKLLVAFNITENSHSSKTG